MTFNMRTAHPLDRFIDQIDNALRTLGAPKSSQQRSTPKPESDELELTPDEINTAASLMRVNHAGEVAAQALYYGHAAGCKSEQTRAHMLHAASEEADHLAWCSDRLEALGAKPSIFGPIWYSGAWMMGYIAAKISDQTALGFVAETERQVEAHLQHHETLMPKADLHSLHVIEAMRSDEAAHGQAAMAAGGNRLPWPVPQLMVKAADVMRWTAAKI
jgi:3-demethoxyubiquinol 3-hydroxylase